MMKLRPALSGGVAILIALTGSTALPAYAKSLQTAVHPPYTMSSALSLAKKLFSIPSAFTLTQESFDNNMQQGQPSYSFAFSYTTPANQNRYIDVTIGADTGVVLNYDRNSDATGFVYPLPVNAAQAEPLAVDWVKKLYPLQWPYVKVQPLVPQQGPLTQPISYTFNFTRYVQGIPAPFDGISMTIDQNGRLTDVSDHWTDAIFPGDSGLIDASQAKAAYTAGLSLYLGYSAVWNSAGEATYYLTYQSPGTTYANAWSNQYGSSYPVGEPVLDATTGKILGSDGTAQKPATFQPPIPVVQGGPSVYPGTVKADWTQSQALRYVKAVVPLVSSARLQDVNVSQTLPAGDLTYNFTFKTAAGQQLTASVDATTGALTNYYGFVPRPRILAAKSARPVKATHHAQSMTQAKINATVTDFIRRAFPHDTGGLAITQAVFLRPELQEKGLTTSFSVEPLVHGLPMLSSNAQITVSAKTGQVISFWANFVNSTGALPSPAKALSEPEATSTWERLEPLSLTYLLTQPQDASESARVVLAYAPVANDYGNDALDALTGQFVNNGLNEQPYAGPIRDLAGISAASQIQLLASHGLLPVSAQGDVHPRTDMTRAQFVMLVVDSLGIGQNGIYNGPALTASQVAQLGVSQASPDFSALQTAFSRGWIDQGKLFDPNGLITRTDAAQILARALGYGSVLAHPGIFTLPAKDVKTISPSQVGADAIAYALGMLPLVDGYFDPAGHVTVAQAAVADVQMVTAYSEGEQLFGSSDGN